VAPPQFRLSGDEGVGLFEPNDVVQPTFARLDPTQVDRLRRVSGLTATVSDILDELGWRLAVPASVLVPRHSGSATIIGHALTLSYLPERRAVAIASRGSDPPKLAHHVVYRLAQEGDVMVIDARGIEGLSVMGGRAVAAALRAGLAGVIVDGGVRDMDDLRRLGLRVWSRGVTPITGKARVEAIAVNRPACCGGVQVHAGDLVIADDTGICFVPVDHIDMVIERVFEVSSEEAADLVIEVDETHT
jgi:4-hydroxy-4-methyl-2-oxoglutarate aldolase